MDNIPKNMVQTSIDFDEQQMLKNQLNLCNNILQNDLSMEAFGKLNKQLSNALQKIQYHFMQVYRDISIFKELNSKMKTFQRMQHLQEKSKQLQLQNSQITQEKVSILQQNQKLRNKNMIIHQQNRILSKGRKQDKITIQKLNSQKTNNKHEIIILERQIRKLAQKHKKTSQLLMSQQSIRKMLEIQIQMRIQKFNNLQREQNQIRQNLQSKQQQLIVQRSQIVKYEVQLYDIQIQILQREKEIDYFKGYLQEARKQNSQLQIKHELEIQQIKTNIFSSFTKLQTKNKSRQFPSPKQKQKPMEQK